MDEKSNLEIKSNLVLSSSIPKREGVARTFPYSLLQELYPWSRDNRNRDKLTPKQREEQQHMLHMQK